MAQTPARDFIKAAVVDFRFCNGDARNHANTAWILENTGVAVAATIRPVHGVPALIGANNESEQTWMTAAQTAMTFEALISLDMLNLGNGGVAAESSSVLHGDWNITFVQTPGVGMKQTVSMALTFNGDAWGGTHYLTQALTGSVYESLLKGSPLHVVVSAQYTVGTTTLDVVTQVNGVYTTDSVVSADQAMVAAPVNTLFGVGVGANPTYITRMWAAYEDDEDVLADLYREARSILPGVVFAPVIPGTIVVTGGGA